MDGALAAYVAGLVDGDGYIGIRRRERAKTTGDRARGASFVVLLTIGGEPNHLIALRAECGGLGSVWIRKREGQRHLAEWKIAGKQAISFMRNIVGDLRLKKNQAEVALSMPMPRSRWAATPAMRTNQETCRFEVQRLNQRGRGKKNGL